MNKGSYSSSRDYSLDRSLDHDVRKDIHSEEFERVRVRQLDEAKVRNVREWVRFDSAAGVWTAALFAAFFAPSIVAWIWSGFGSPTLQGRSVFDWILGGIGFVGVLVVASTLFILSRACRLDTEGRRRRLRGVALLTSMTVVVVVVSEVFGENAPLIGAISDWLPRVSIVPLAALGALGLAIANIGRNRNGTKFAAWGGWAAFLLFLVLLIAPGVRDQTWGVVPAVILCEVGICYGGFVLWDHYEYRLVRGVDRG